LSEQALNQPYSGPVSLYVHIPFCRKRCNYCDFNTYANRDDFIPEYVKALCLEIHQLGQVCNENLHTIYFGGGTPSILPSDAYHKIIGEIKYDFKVDPVPEISMEINPGTPTPGFLQEIKALGINRLSIGMQSSKPEELAYLGRIHSPLEVIETVKIAKQAGIDNISLDLMFGLPGQSLASWQDSLDFTLRLNPSHLSLYSLTYEKGTAFDRWHRKGMLPYILEDLPADMFEMAISLLNDKNFIQYEISNWALKDGYENQTYICKHNLQYWLNQPYLGIGAGAHSLYIPFRWENIKSIPGYIQASRERVGRKISFGQIKKIRLDKRTQMQETLFMGLRLLDMGVSNENFRQRFGISIQDVFPKEINELIDLGLIAWKGAESNNLCLTKRGCLMGNQVFLRFVD
jgi:oxygen-independent coproporphyrinogen-3 oxidase